MTVPTLQIYILARDRVDYLRQTLRSALDQQGDGIEVVVSDNSEHGAVSKMLTEEFPGVNQIRRWPALGAFDHFRTVIDEATADLVVMFHDDDLLRPGYAATMRRYFDLHPALGAVACNATVIRGDTVTDEWFSPDRGRDIELFTPEQLLAEYCSLSTKGPAPFPGYMYRCSHIQGLFLEPRQGGKYSDVSFLLKVLTRGPMMWLRLPHMHYRIHGHNDSAIEAVGQRLRLLRFVYATTSVRPRSTLVTQYRYRYWLSWWRGQAKADREMPWRRRVVRRFLVNISIWYAFTRPALWARGFSKLARMTRHTLRLKTS